jgi:tetratricopeptide (TPR) repeat protein
VTDSPGDTDLRALEAAVFETPDDPAARRRLAVALRNRKRYWEATEHLTQAVRLDPDDRETTKLLLVTAHRYVWGRFHNVRVWLFVAYVLASAWTPIPLSARLTALVVALVLLLERKRRAEARRAMLPREVAAALRKVEFRATWGLRLSRRALVYLGLLSALLCVLCVAASFSVPPSNQPVWLIVIAFTGGIAYWSYRKARQPVEQQGT